MYQPTTCITLVPNSLHSTHTRSPGNYNVIRSIHRDQKHLFKPTSDYVTFKERRTPRSDKNYLPVLLNHLKSFQMLFIIVADSL